MKKILTLIIALILVGFEAYQQQNGFATDGLQQTSTEKAEGKDNTRVLQAYQDRQGDVQVQGEGVVVKVLRDDLKGSRHQKFILKVGAGLTVLIAHNIDLAPRIGGLQTGDRVGYYGEYEWNSKGGVIHWTHKDPKGYHASGWLKHEGRVYQ